MIVSLHCSRWERIPQPVPQRRRVIILGASEASVSCAFHLGLWAMLIEQRGPLHESPAGVRRWEPPDFTGGPPVGATPTWDELWRGLIQLISGETRLGTRVTAIDVHDRRLTLANGESFVYDKLVSSIGFQDLQALIVDATPGRLRSREAWRYWLNGRDVELLDDSTQQFFGDVDDQAAGKRVADSIRAALTLRYAPRSSSRDRAAGLFRPRLVMTGQ